MAARNPIVLDSSPAELRPPSITPSPPPPIRRTNDSSSPSLASPSTFVRPLLAKGLTSGSRAQQIPHNATSGFSSAASLLRAHRTEEANKTKQHEDTAQHEDQNTGKKAAGKLSRPSKTKARKPSLGDMPLRSPLQDFAYRDYTVKKDRQDDAVPKSPSLANETQIGDTYKYRQPSMSIFDFPGQDERPTTLSDASVKKAKKSRTKIAKTDPQDAVKKPRKRAAKAEGSTEPAKKPRKKFSKSASIILNSDEPDAVEAGTAKTTPKPAEQDPLDRVRAATDDQEASAYFADQAQKESADRHVSMAEQTTSPQTLNLGSFAHPQTGQNAAKRRLSWTPVKNTTEPVTRRSQTPVEQEDSHRHKASFMDIVSGLGYSNRESIADSERAITTETLTKRRKIELADASVLAPIQQPASKPSRANKSKEAKPKATKKDGIELPKKPKATKKKPQTITDLATKAYRPEDVEILQPTVSTFFAGQATDVEPILDTGEAQDIAKDTVKDTVKEKKPRKPRAKKAEADINRSTKTAKPKKQKAGEIPHAKLYSPGAARSEEQSQGFLFGTSSQLAVEDSPTFIRQMQAALQDSEITAPSQMTDSPTRRSRTRVTSGLDGMNTNLSVGQAYLDHWCQSARDDDGSLWKVGPREPTRHQELSNGQTLDHPVEKTETQTSHVELPKPNGEQETTHPSTEAETKILVDLCDSSPVPRALERLSGAAELATDVDEMERRNTTKNAQDSPAPAHLQSDDSWMLLSSDDQPQNVASITISQEQTALSDIAKALPPVPQLLRSATSPSLRRHALQTLDANVSMMARTSPIKAMPYVQSHASSTYAPQREAESTENRQADKRPAVKRRGRPLGSKNKPKTVMSASQPTPSAEWANIDEISDSDTPPTPSPPRRRANSTPPAVKPLDLETVASPTAKIKASNAVTTTSSIKANDENWPALMTGIFPRITTTIRSTPPSMDIANPTWHEKILLYDPIILEDLTAWLNEQGLRLEVQRMKARTKTKGRKKKDASCDEDEYETIREELKPWMVQKWCEERSICCLWKEGLNGAKRARY